MSPRPLAVRLLLVVIAFAAAGVLAGVVWHALWTPPSGVVYQDEWLIDSAGAPHDVEGTGLYVAVALVTGMLVGFATTLAVRRDEIAVLVAVTLGAALAGVLMAVTGHALGPPDPRPLAAGQDDFTSVPADLRVEGRSPYLALPAGALTAAVTSFMLLGGSVRKRSEAEPDG